jgi:hypothetical protein
VDGGGHVHGLELPGSHAERGVVLQDLFDVSVLIGDGA